MLEAITKTIEDCCKLCDDVEFVADDATRSDPAFVYEAVSAAISAGAKTVTVCDTAGAMLPNEFTAFLRELYAAIPELKDVTLGVSCSDGLSMADSCAIAAVRYGAGEIKAASYRLDNVSLPNVAKVLSAKGEFYNATCAVRTTVMKRITGQIAWMCQTGRSKNSPFDNGVQEDDGSIYLTSHDDLSAVMKVASRLGYDLSEEDGAKVYEAFQVIADKK
jgi:2-isopropylmalate synthase